MAASTVFLSGLGGLGVELAKNIALAGVKLLTLHDTKDTEWTDLATNFYLSPTDIGKNRAECSIKKISELNPYVKTNLSTVDLSKDFSFLSNYKCVILTDAPLSLQIQVNNFCHENKIKFISADVRGVFCWAFCDFGKNFEIFDKNGEELKEILVGSITKANPGVVTCLADEKHGFEDGDLVTFREVLGMPEVNGVQHKIKVVSPSSFSIGDTSNFGAYQRNGVVAQLKEAIHLDFKTLAESLSDPPIVPADFAKMDNPLQVHIGMQALHAFQEKHKKLPEPWDQNDAKELISLANEINSTKMKSKVEKLDYNLLQTLSFTSRGSIVPLTSFIGGVVAQETLKALSGKYTPLLQYVYLDAIEAVPELTTSKDNFQPKGTREDGQVICLGRELCTKLSNQKLFMIGCGAIGCEMLKNYAMLGVGSGPNGNIFITDNDLIEKSNLNRQFLFRSKDLQQPKSETAGNAVKQMNPALKISAYVDKVGTDTEAKYNDAFFESLDLVVNALDNVNARLYVDSRCVTNKKPLLESGTLGPKGHVQVVIPFLTESYGSKRDPPEKDVPFCTLKSFPNQMEHCIEWARDFSFGGLLVSKPMQWNQLVDEDNLLEKLNTKEGGGLDIKVVRTSAKLLKNRPASFEDCIAFARKKYEDYFVNKATQLLHNFPLDHKVDDKGTLFWTSPKRPPKSLPFQWEDETSRNFIVSLACLLAEVWGLQRHTDLSKIQEVVAKVNLPKFVPKSAKKIETDESKKKEEVQSEAPKTDEIEEALKVLSSHFKSKAAHYKMKPLEFEKDDDTNFHVDFISATANLRARMYSIPEVDRLKVKAIAGRIMPAIATTTAAVSGCVSLELIKLVKGCKLEHFKNLFMNLALPFWAFTEPGEAEKKKITGKAFYTLWDRWEVKEGDLTLDAFIKYFETKHGLQVSGVFKGAVMVYVPMFPGHAKRKPNKMSVLLKRKEEKYEDLIVTFQDEKGEDISGPPVRFFY